MVIENSFTTTFLDVFLKIFNAIINFWEMLNHTFFSLQLTGLINFVNDILDFFGISISLDFLPNQIDFSFLTIITTLLVFALFLKLLSLLIPN